MTLPTLPSPQSITPAQIDDYATQVEVFAEATDNVHEVRDLRNKWGAIAEYVRRASRQGVARAEATERKLEARIGVLTPAPIPGSHASVNAGLGLHRNQAAEFRLMADHPDIVDAVIAESDDASPPSRRKVIGRIRDHKMREMNQEGRQALDDAGVVIADDPIVKAQARFRTEVVAGLLGRLSDLQSYADRYDVAVVAEHVAADRVAASIVTDIHEAINWLETLHTTITKETAA
jgi:hypothetical protein